MIVLYWQLARSIGIWTFFVFAPLAAADDCELYVLCTAYVLYCNVVACLGARRSTHMHGIFRRGCEATCNPESFPTAHTLHPAAVGRTASQPARRGVERSHLTSFAGTAETPPFHLQFQSTARIGPFSPLGRFPGRAARVALVNCLTGLRVSTSYCRIFAEVPKPCGLCLVRIDSG